VLAVARSRWSAISSQASDSTRYSGISSPSVLQLSMRLSSGVAFGATMRVGQTAAAATGWAVTVAAEGAAATGGSAVAGGVDACGGGASRAGAAVDLRQYWSVDGRRARDTGIADVVVVVVVEAPEVGDVVVGFPVGDVDDAVVETGTGILLPSLVASLGDNRGGCRENMRTAVSLIKFLRSEKTELSLVKDTFSVERNCG